MLLDKYVEMCLLIDPLTIVLFCRHNYWDFLKKYNFDETYILGSYKNDYFHDLKHIFVDIYSCEFGLV